MRTQNRRLASIAAHIVPTTPTARAVQQQEETEDGTLQLADFLSSIPTAGTVGDHCKTLSEKPLRVLVTGAAGQIAYSLLGMIASGQMLGFHQPIILHLLDIPPMSEILKGVVMELEDCAFPLVKGIVSTTDPKVAFTDVDVACLVGAFPRKEGMERKELLSKNADIFKSNGSLLNSYASRNVKVVVVGNPANTNCLICQKNAPNLPPQNFTALTRLDHNRALSQIVLKLNVPVSSVSNAIIWGNHSATQVPDLSQALIRKDSFSLSANSVINDSKWVLEAFTPTVQQRGAAVIKARKSSSAVSAARAITQHVHDWLLGTKEGQFVSMGVVSDGSYGVPKGLVFSYPVVCKNGNWEIFQGLKWDEFREKSVEKTTKELLDEASMAGISLLN